MLYNKHVSLKESELDAWVSLYVNAKKFNDEGHLVWFPLYMLLRAPPPTKKQKDEEEYKKRGYTVLRFLDSSWVHLGVSVKESGGDAVNIPKRYYDLVMQGVDAVPSDSRASRTCVPKFKEEQLRQQKHPASVQAGLNKGVTWPMQLRNGTFPASGAKRPPPSTASSSSDSSSDSSFDSSSDSDSDPDPEPDDAPSSSSSTNDPMTITKPSIPHPLF